MALYIRPFRNNDMEEVTRLSLLAWEPVFRSFEQVLGREIYTKIYPDWVTSQRAVVEQVCKDSDKTIVLIAEVDGAVAGFIAYELNMNDTTGEVQLLAVHPEYQNRGIGTELNTFVLEKM